MWTCTTDSERRSCKGLDTIPARFSCMVPYTGGAKAIHMVSQSGVAMGVLGAESRMRTVFCRHSSYRFLSAGVRFRSNRSIAVGFLEKTKWNDSSDLRSTVPHRHSPIEGQQGRAQSHAVKWAWACYIHGNMLRIYATNAKGGQPSTKEQHHASYLVDSGRFSTLKHTVHPPA